MLLDLDAFQANLNRVAREVTKARKNLRPHAKAHKCVEIARRQIAGGACGICVATVAEAELMAKAGIEGLLLTSPLADPAKIARILQTGAMVVVDHQRQIEWYSEAAEAAGKKVDVLVDLDVGDHRTGARSIEQTLEIAQAVERRASLRLRGLQAYSVSGSHAANADERRRISEETVRVAAEVRDAAAGNGISLETVSGGSTGSWQIDVELPEFTELQAGSYVLMDLAYKRLGLDLRNALTVLATVVSANHDRLVTVDAGLKAFSTDRGYGPEALRIEGSKYRWGGDEFGMVELVQQGPRPKLGDRIEFIPPHCDPTVNLYDRIYALRGDKVDAIWPVMDRMRMPVISSHV